MTTAGRLFPDWSWKRKIHVIDDFCDNVRQSICSIQCSLNVTLSRVIYQNVYYTTIAIKLEMVFRTPILAYRNMAQH